MKVRRNYIGIGLLAILMIFACDKKELPVPDSQQREDLTLIPFDPTSRVVTYPDHFPRLESPEDNLLTDEGIDLGRHLFYDPILSLDSTIACASCHISDNGFTDPKVVSVGVDGTLGKRQSMPLLNVAFFKNGLFWDGKAHTLEELSLIPVTDPLEMKNTWSEVIERLARHPEYPQKFRKAFGIKDYNEISKELSVKAIAQFLRIMVSSGGSKWDKVQAGKDVFTDQELFGHDLFFDVNAELPDAECSHCHNVPLATSNDYFNNGLFLAENLEDFNDTGLGKITGIIADNGKFKAPSLRNIIHTAPYMHNGQFSTLDEVIDHYNSGGHFSPNKDPLIRPLGLTEEMQEALKAFILTMTEPDFNQRPELQSPFK